jgi:hypothetical protein
MSIMTPILNESADAVFQTVNVEPLVEKAVSDVVLTEALTPEVLERMKALNDPQVQEVLAGFKKNVENAVQESSDILKSGVADNIGDLVGQVANKLSEAGKSLIANIPGVGIGMAALETADAVALAADKGKGVVDGIQSALKPINALQTQVAEVKNAVNEATESATSAATENAISAATTSAATENAISGATENATSATSAISEATTSGATTSATNAISGATTSAATENATNAISAATTSGATTSATNATSGATESAATTSGATTSEANPKVESEVSVKGGSRKRRRIHKLSRRIERTLRRVQKKYGLKDKNDFLRRSVRKMK